MTCSTAIYSILSGDAGILGLICQYQGSPAIYPTTMPAGTGAYPAIVYHAAGSKPLGDSSRGPGNIFRQKVALACIAKQPDEAAALSSAVYQALVGTLGVVSGLDINAWLDDESESSSGWADGGDGYEVFQTELNLDVYFRPVT
jgi:hypothetical protein